VWEYESSALMQGQIWNLAYTPELCMIRLQLSFVGLCLKLPWLNFILPFLCFLYFLTGFSIKNYKHRKLVSESIPEKVDNV
jgi:hypothetical protein